MNGFLILHVRFRLGYYVPTRTTQCTREPSLVYLLSPSSLAFKRGFARAALRNILEGGESSVCCQTPFPPRSLTRTFPPESIMKKKCKCVRQGDTWMIWQSIIHRCMGSKLRHTWEPLSSLHLPLRAFSKLCCVLLLSVFGSAHLRCVPCSPKFKSCSRLQFKMHT